MRLSEDREKLNDGELLESYRNTGDLGYFGILYNRYMPMIYGLCLKYLRDAPAAEDAVMQIFEDIVPKVGDAGIREFRLWIYTVARNHCFQILRKKKITFTDNYERDFVETDDILHLLSKGDEQKRTDALGKCIEELPEPQKVSVQLFFFEQMSYADITDKTKFSLKSVKSYIQNGKRNLKICMERSGYTK